jgi:hypothetical protein
VRNGRQTAKALNRKPFPHPLHLAQLLLFSKSYTSVQCEPSRRPSRSACPIPPGGSPSPLEVCLQGPLSLAHCIPNPVPTKPSSKVAGPPVCRFRLLQVTVVGHSPLLRKRRDPDATSVDQADLCLTADARRRASRNLGMRVPPSEVRSGKIDGNAAPTGTCDCLRPRIHPSANQPLVGSKRRQSGRRGAERA